jgi:hypothetical protein
VSAPYAAAQFLQLEGRTRSAEEASLAALRDAERVNDELKGHKSALGRGGLVHVASSSLERHPTTVSNRQLGPAAWIRSLDPKRRLQGTRFLTIAEAIK